MAFFYPFWNPSTSGFIEDNWLATVSAPDIQSVKISHPVASDKFHSTLGEWEQRGKITPEYYYKNSVDLMAPPPKGSLGLYGSLDHILRSIALRIQFNKYIYFEYTGFPPQGKWKDTNLPPGNLQCLFPHLLIFNQILLLFQDSVYSISSLSPDDPIR